MLGFAVAPLVYGPASDRYGRKPVVLFAATLFTIAAIGCALAGSLRSLLIWRLVQGAGAGASMTIALAIVRDLFDGQAARTKLSYVSIAMMVVPMIAPSAGAALLALGGWRAIHAALAGVGLLLLLVILLGFAESARIDPAIRLVPSVVARSYLHVLMHPLCLGYILVNAAAGARSRPPARPVPDGDAAAAPSCGRSAPPSRRPDSARAGGTPGVATIPRGAGCRRHRPTLVRHPLYQQESTLRHQTRILVHVHPGDLPISADSLATDSLTGLPRMNNLHSNHS